MISNNFFFLPLLLSFILPMRGHCQKTVSDSTWKGEAYTYESEPMEPIHSGLIKRLTFTQQNYEYEYFSMRGKVISRGKWKQKDSLLLLESNIQNFDKIDFHIDELIIPEQKFIRFAFDNECVGRTIFMSVVANNNRDYACFINLKTGIGDLYLDEELHSIQIFFSGGTTIEKKVQNSKSNLIKITGCFPGAQWNYKIFSNDTVYVKKGGLELERELYEKNNK